MKKKTKDKVPELKRQIKSLQEQVTAQDEMMHTMAIQISEITRELKEKETRNADILLNPSNGSIDSNKLCSVISRIECEVGELKEHHASCENLSKTIDNLGALCASAMVAAGTKLHHEIDERRGEASLPSKSEGDKRTGRQAKPTGYHRRQADIIDAQLSPAQDFKDAGSGHVTLNEKRSYASVISEDTPSGVKNDNSAADGGELIDGKTASNENLVQTDNEGFTVVKKRQKNKSRNQNRKLKCSAVMIGGANVRRIATAAKNEFDIDGAAFKSTPGMLVQDAHRNVNTAVREAGAREVDVVLHVGSDDLAEQRSVDFVLEGLASVIESSHNTSCVREVIVCSVEERWDSGRDVYENSCLMNEQLRDLCHSYGARFLDLRARLQECRFRGINRTGLLYTSEGSHNVSQLMLSEVYGFLD